MRAVRSGQRGDVEKVVSEDPVKSIKWSVVESPYGWDAKVEMPAEIVSIDNQDGRLWVELIDGRMIDMTDWFSCDSKPS